VKIVFVSNSLSGGGAERSINTLANELISYDYDVTQIVLNNSAQDLVKNLAHLVEIKREWKAGIFSTFFRFMIFNFYLIKLKPKILILNCELAELYGAFSFFSGKIIAVEHTPKPWKDREKIGLLVRWVLRARRASWVKVSSLIQIWPYKNKTATTIENPIAQFKRRSSFENKRIDQIVYLGRFTTQKQTSILPSIAKFSKKKLVLIGTGDLLKSQLQECHEKNVEVISHGFVNDPWSLVLPNSLLLVPSAYEGDGMVVVEAIMRNVPFLISDIPEFRRFGLPERNYCSELDDFIKSISEYEDDLEKLEIPDGIFHALLSERNPRYISHQWVTYLDSMIR
jgi:glycosyltransferase involved in cell wall biosynthesis